MHPLIWWPLKALDKSLCFYRVRGKNTSPCVSVCGLSVPESGWNDTARFKVVFRGRFPENLATAQTKQGWRDKRNLDTNVKCLSSHEEWHRGLCGERSLGRGPAGRVQGWGHYLHLHSTQSSGGGGGGERRDPEGCRAHQHTATAIRKSSTAGRVFMLSL